MKSEKPEKRRSFEPSVIIITKDLFSVSIHFFPSSQQCNARANLHISFLFSSSLSHPKITRITLTKSGTHYSRPFVFLVQKLMASLVSDTRPLSFPPMHTYSLSHSISLSLIWVIIQIFLCKTPPYQFPFYSCKNGGMNVD